MPWPMRLIFMVEMAAMLFIVVAGVADIVKAYRLQRYDAPRGFSDWLGVSCAVVLGLCCATMLAALVLVP